MTGDLKHPPFWHLRVTDVKTVDEFLDKYYRPDRYRDHHTPDQEDD